MSDDERNEATYLQDRAERAAWEQRRGLSLSRRRLLQLTVGGVGAAALGPLVGRLPMARADHVAVVKATPADLFYIHGSNREMRWEAMAGRGYYTPNELFFVRNHSRTPHIDVATWRLVVEGSGVERRVELTYDELLAMPSVTETKFIECAGNGRSQFAAAYGKPASGTPWRLGAIGVAEWTGVPLGAVLERAGLKPTAIDVMPEGLDSLHVRRPMPIAKALEDDTLVVYGMNGQTLPPDHGFPVRLLVPGWIGVANVKWVGRIEVSETPLYSPWNTTTYVMVGDAYPDRPVIYGQEVKSAFELPWGGSILAGPQVLTGRSWSGHAKIDKVEVSTDGGATWQLAALAERNIPKAWVEWALPWTPQPGTYSLKARATDARGNTQPDTVPFNDQGYLYWAVVNHPITVT
jgi:sulfane dehydrogenase subunit SoxC